MTLADLMDHLVSGSYSHGAHDTVAAGKTGEFVIPELFRSNVPFGPIGKDNFLRLPQVEVVLEDRLAPPAPINPRPRLHFLVASLIVTRWALHAALLQFLRALMASSMV